MVDLAVANLKAVVGVRNGNNQSPSKDPPYGSDANYGNVANTTAVV